MNMHAPKQHFSAAVASRPATPWFSMDRDQRIKAVTELRDAGKKRSEIAADLGVSSTSLGAYCLRHNIAGLDGPERPTGGWYDLSTEDKIAAINAASVGNKDRRQVADHLNITMNALHGFMWRQGVRGVSSVRIAINLPPPEAMVPAEPVSPETWLAIHGAPVSLVENSGCCWPIDTAEGQRCCGARKAKGSYCAEHRALAYRPARGVAPPSEAAIMAMDAKSNSASFTPSRYTPSQGKKQVWRDRDE